MEALVPAFIAALLTQIGDRPALLAAILADRYGRPLTIVFAAALAHAALNSLAAIGSIAIAPTLTPNAQAMFLAVALFVGGFGALLRVKTPDRLESWGTGSLVTGFLGTFTLALGAQTQFFTLAFAVRGQPWYAMAGATAGAVVVTFVAAVLGELSWARIPFRGLRALIGVLFLVAAAVIGLGAARLI